MGFAALVGRSLQVQIASFLFEGFYFPVSASAFYGLSQLCPLSIHLITEIRMIKGHINYLQLFVLRMGGSIFEYSVF